MISSGFERFLTVFQFRKRNQYASIPLFGLKNSSENRQKLNVINTLLRQVTP